MSYSLSRFKQKQPGGQKQSGTTITIGLKVYSKNSSSAWYACSVEHGEYTVQYTYYTCPTSSVTDL